MMKCHKCGGKYETSEFYREADETYRDVSEVYRAFLSDGCEKAFTDNVCDPWFWSDEFWSDII